MSSISMTSCLQNVLLKLNSTIICSPRKIKPYSKVRLVLTHTIRLTLMYITLCGYIHIFEINRIEKDKGFHYTFKRPGKTYNET